MKDTITRKLYNAHHCYVCGTKQKDGLHASFYVLKSKRLLTIYHPDQDHHGYPNILHGGITASLLDEGMARSIQIEADTPFGITTHLDITYKKKTPMNQTLYVVAWIVSNKSRMFYTEGYLTNGQDIFAYGKASYMKVDIEDIAPNIGFEMVLDSIPITTVELPQ
jgi:acyl-coenzyme A thioesterase PaaI-like protein